MCTLTENLLDLRRAESIRGVPLNNEDINFIEKYCKQHNILKVQCGSCHEFSKPKSFFMQKQNEFTFLKNGCKKNFLEVDVDCQDFTAFKISGKTMHVYAYFRCECD